MTYSRPLLRADARPWLLATVILALLVPLLQVAAQPVVLPDLFDRHESATFTDQAAAVATAPVTNNTALTHSSATWAASVQNGTAVVATSVGITEVSTASIAGLDLSSGAASTVDGRHEVAHGTVTEWWQRHADGLEQGWTFASAPTADNRIVIDVAVNGAHSAVLESPTSVRLDSTAGPLWYRGLVAWDANDVTLPAHMSLSGDTITLTVDTMGAAYPVIVDPILTESVRLDATGTSNGDQWGTDIDVDGDYGLVGSPGEDVSGAEDGAVTFLRFLDFGDGDPTNDTYTADNTRYPNPAYGPEAGYGTSVAIDADATGVNRAIALVAAPAADVNGDDSGAVEVYGRAAAGVNANQWILLDTLYYCGATNCDPTVAADTFANAAFGAALDVRHNGGGSGWELAIGAPGANSGGGAFQYHAIEFTSTGAFTINDTQVVVSDNSTQFDLGSDVAIGPDFEYLAVSVDDTDTNASVIIYRDSGAGLVFHDDISDFGPDAAQIAIDNRLLVVSDDYGGGGGAGGPGPGVLRVYADAFDGVAGTTQIFNLLGAANAQFGFDVDIARVDDDKSVLAFGAPGVSPNARAFLYEFDTTNVVGGQVQPVVMPESATRPAGSGLGRAVATDGIMWAAGAPDFDRTAEFNANDGTADTGRVREAAVTDLTVDDGDATELNNTFSAFQNSENDEYGTSVDIDGNRMVIGVPKRDSVGVRAGAAEVWERTAVGGAWSLTATLNPDGNSPVDANYGTSVSIDGDIIAVGSEGDGFLVFSYDGFSWQQDLVSLAGGPYPGGFGESVAVSNNNVFVGGTDVGAAGGQVLVFTSQMLGGLNSWTELTSLSSPSASPGFGTSIDATYVTGVNEWILAVGDPLNAPAPTVHRYMLDDGTGVFIAQGTAGGIVGTGFGQSVAIDPVTTDIVTTATSGGILFWRFDFQGIGLGLVSSRFETVAIADGTPPASDAIDVYDNLVAVRDNGAVEVWQTDSANAVSVLDFIPTNIDDPNPNNDQFGASVELSADGTLVAGAPLWDQTVPLDPTVRNNGAVFTLEGVAAIDVPTLNFEFDLAPGSAADVQVAPSGLAATDFAAGLVDQAAGESSLVASPLGALPLGALPLGATPLGALELTGTPLGALPLGATPLGATDVGGLDIIALFLENDSLANIPLVEINRAGGWESVIAGTSLADQPINELTLGDVAAIDNPSNPNGLAATPLGALDLSGTPLGALPLGALPLGATPLGALPLGATGLTNDDVCSLLEVGLSGAACNTYLDETSAIEAGVQGAPLGALPLGALPLGALPLGATELEPLPLGALPLGALELEQSPLGALPLGALPLGALPLGALPLGALPLGALPLGALPLGALDVSGVPLGATPLGALQLDAVDANAAPLGATPLGALPLGATSVGSTPLGALPLGALPLGALNLGSTPLGATPLGATPLGATGVDSAPLGALPLGALALAEVPLGALPLGALAAGSAANEQAWCDLLVDIGADYDCTYVDPATTTLFEISVQGAPLGALPLGALPLGALPLGALPLGATPLGALPLGALPLGALPLGALPLGATPLGALPLGATNVGAIPLGALDIVGSPLGALPLGATPLGATPLGATPLGALPLGALPLGALPLGATPLGALEVNGAPLGALPLGALDIVGSPLGALPLGALPLGALPLGALDCDRVDCEIDTLGDAIVAGAANGLLAENLAVLDGAFGTITFAQLLDAAGLTEADVNFNGITLGTAGVDTSQIRLGDIPADQFGATTLDQVKAALWAVTFADLVDALPTDEATAAGSLDTILSDYGTANNTTLADFEVLGDVTLDDLTTDGNVDLQLEDLGKFVGLIHVQTVIDFFGPDVSFYPGFTLGDLDNDQLSDLTVDQLGDLSLFDLIGIADFDELSLNDLYDVLDQAGVLDGYTFGDLLVALVAADQLPFEGLDFTEVEVNDLPAGTVTAVTFEALVSIGTTSVDHTVEVSVDLPGTVTYVPGSSSDEEPTLDGNRLTWTLVDVPPVAPVALTFDVLPEVSLGVTDLDASARIIGFDDVAAAGASVNVTEGLEPNDFPATTSAAENTIYLTYITSANDHDVFEIDVVDNDQLAISLTSLSADLDVALYVRPDDALVATALTGTSPEAPLTPITDPDADAADSEPLNDFRRLDAEDAGLELVQVSNSAGTEDELIVTERLVAGTYYVQVYGANGATNDEPAALQLQVIEAETRPDCVAEGAVTAPASAPVTLGSQNTAILVNYQRIQEFYSLGDRQAVETAVNDFVTYVNGAGLGIDAVAIPVDSFGPVQAAYAAWDNPANVDDACDPVVANAVVDSIITNAIDPLRSTLEHVMILGSDQLIPMARLADETTIANEYDFRHEFDDDLFAGAGTMNALTSSFWSRTYLSDEPYGESSARELSGGRFLYVSDIGLGRLVETPADIIGQLDHFETFNGELTIETGQVLGYDFLSDGSQEIFDDLNAGLPGAVDGSLVDGELDADSVSGNDSLNHWTSVEAGESVTDLGGAAADIVSLNAHFDHYRALPADEGDLFETSDVIGGITVDLVFSMGCHGGLNVSDVQVANTSQDWAQTFGESQAVFIGNTGFGYGDTETVAYTERLLAIFAEEVVRPFENLNGDKTTIGQSLAFAKNRYVADVATFSVYDEKAVQEATFYGIPFYRVGLAAEQLPPAPTNVTSPDVTGVPALGRNVTPTNTAAATPDGIVYSNPDVDGGDPQIISVPGYPIQPSLSSDVSVVVEPDTSVLAQQAHGALILGMTSSYQAGVDPVVAAAIYDEVATLSGEAPLGDVVFPSKPATINTITTPAGERQNLVLATGQFRSTDDTVGVQRLDSEISVVVYYADPAETDFTSPTIGTVDSTLENGQLTITLDVADNDSAIVRVVVLAISDPGSGSGKQWIPIDLTPNGAVAPNGGSQWAGSAAVPGTEVEFLVQALDEAGNVGYATNKARNFNDDGTVEPEPPTPDVDATEAATNFDAGTGWYTGPATVSVTTTAGVAEYSVDGAPFAPVSGGGFTITGDGVHTWAVVLGDQELTGQVLIDTSGAPVVTIAPANGSVLDVDEVPTLSFDCDDPSIQTCDATVDGVSSSLNADLPTTIGSHTIVVTATDVFGATTTVTHTYTVVAPTLGIVIEPTNLAGNGSGIHIGPATITVTADDPAEYSIDNGPFQPVSGSSFTISGDGDRDFTVRLVGNPSITQSGSVTIDATAPVVTISSPANNATFNVGDVATLGFACADANSSTCQATINGAPASNGDALPTGAAGTFTVFVEGTDLAGNTADLTHTYTVAAASNPPVVVSSMVDNIAAPGEESTVMIEFTGDPGVTAIIDWGDGTTCSAPGDPDCEITDESGTEPGLFTATHIYGAPGVFDITVTLSSAGGASVDVDLQTATCTIIGTNASEVINGTIGDDVICGLGGDDRINGLRGDDIIYGGNGRDILYGNSGSDTIYGGRDRDIIVGGGGVDLLVGGGGNDYLNGQSGNDMIFGRQGNDALIGGSGNDVLQGNRGNDYLSGQSGNDFIRGGRGNDRLIGSTGDDELRGSAGSDVLFGGYGDDDLFGGGGNDYLYGQAHDDNLDGGADQDLCRGGGGSNSQVACEF